MKTKRCRVYYHRISKKYSNRSMLFHRVVIWPDKTVTVSKVRINNLKEEERHLETYKPHVSWPFVMTRAT